MGASCSLCVLHLTPSPDKQPITNLIVSVSLQGGTRSLFQTSVKAYYVSHRKAGRGEKPWGWW